jgi:hypothetical protein
MGGSLQEGRQAGRQAGLRLSPFRCILPGIFLSSRPLPVVVSFLSSPSPVWTGGAWSGSVGLWNVAGDGAPLLLNRLNRLT